MKENRRDLLQKRLVHLVKECKGVLKRWIETGDAKCQPRSGRKRKSTKRSDRTLVRISLGNRRLNSKELARELKESSGFELSAPTVRRRLLENGLRGCKARKKPLLTEKQRKRRLDWARFHVKWPIEKWRKVLLSDEQGRILHRCGVCGARPVKILPALLTKNY